ncbi:MAG: alpha/beta hydrolase-fold protein, partial [Boseongicola sp.]|nr:alpha/beta hydrolase-fold protein [Boseongicola sp.]
AGFYIDAVEEPWAPHFKMQTYILSDLPTLLVEHFPVDMARQGITGHSMGGHGALTLAIKSPGRFRSVSAFSPICNPTQSDWGQKQFNAYLGGLENAALHDATELVKNQGIDIPVLVDTGTEDQFGDLLKTEALATALTEKRSNATVRMQDGYDHSYFFVSTFMGDHIAFHSDALWD